MTLWILQNTMIELHSEASLMSFFTKDVGLSILNAMSKHIYVSNPLKTEDTTELQQTEVSTLRRSFCESTVIVQFAFFIFFQMLTGLEIQ